MQKIKFCLIFCYLSTLFIQFYGQENANTEILEIGKRCPEILLNNINYYSKPAASLNDFKGKWLVLDFWNRYCTACVASFPETNTLQKKYQDSVQFILVGYSGSQYTHKPDEKEIKLLYEKFRLRLNLQLPIIYDSVLFHQFDIGSCPYIVVIDGNGYVRGITYKLNSDDMDAYFSQRYPQKALTMNIHQKNAFDSLYNPRKPFLLNGNGGHDTGFIFRSVLADYNSDMPRSTPYSIFSFADYGMFQVLGATPELLYRYAFTGFYNITFDNPLYGKYYNTILFEDSTGNPGLQGVDLNKQFSYSISAPLNIHDTLKFQRSIQHDLQNYFGLDARVEVRKMPYLKLIATTSARNKLISTGNTPALTSTTAELALVNLPVKTLVEALAGFYPSRPPFIDETGITGRIDLSVKTIITDFQSLKKSLAAKGLLLVESRKDMKVIVIRKMADTIIAH